MSQTNCSGQTLYHVNPTSSASTSSLQGSGAQTILSRGQANIAGLLPTGRPGRAESRTGNRREASSRQASSSPEVTLPGDPGALPYIFKQTLARTDASILGMMKRQQALMGRNLAFLERLGAGAKARQIASAGAVGELAATVLKAVQSPEAQPIVRSLAKQSRPFLAGHTAFEYLEVRFSP